MSGPQDLATVENVPHGRTARRLEWAHLPPGVRRLVEERLGSPVAKAESQGSGFTPGFASRLTGEDGSRLFVKAASKKAQRQFAESYAEEARNVRLLPAGVPATRLLWTHDDDLWVVLAFECVDGHTPRRPWRADELGACLDTLEEIARVLSPVPDGFDLRPITTDLPALVTGWDHLRSLGTDWPHLDEAASLARRLPDLPDQGFAHADGRDDNFLVTSGGTALLCDWNWPAIAPVWVDTVNLLMTAYGDGLDADALLVERGLTRDVDPEHIDAWLAAMCGFMLECRDRPAPPSSPYLRAHNNWWAETTWDWLARRRGWT